MLSVQQVHGIVMTLRLNFIVPTNFVKNKNGKSKKTLVWSSILKEKL